MPDSMPVERRKMPVFLGAELELPPRAQGINGSIARAQELLRQIPDSVMPGQFAWNFLLAARHEGFAGTITTRAAAREPRLRERLGLPRHVAVCAVMPLGRPLRQLTKLTRKAVSEFAVLDRWGGPPLTAPRRD